MNIQVGWSNFGGGCRAGGLSTKAPWTRPVYIFAIRDAIWLLPLSDVSEGFVGNQVHEVLKPRQNRQGRIG